MDIVFFIFVALISDLNSVVLDGLDGHVMFLLNFLT